MPLWLIPAGSAGAALVLALAGAISLLAPLRRVKAQAEDLELRAATIVDVARLERTTKRITDDLNGMQALVARAGAALAEIGEGLRALRIPEALVALRTAGMAIRALRSLL